MLLRTGIPTGCATSDTRPVTRCAPATRGRGWTSSTPSTPTSERRSSGSSRAAGSVGPRGCSRTPGWDGPCAGTRPRGWTGPSGSATTLWARGSTTEGRAFLELATAGFRYATGDLAGTAAAGRTSVDHDPGTDPPIRQDALILQGSGEMVLDEPAAAETLARAVAEARAIDDLWAMSHALLADGQRLLIVGDFDAATATLTEAERLARELGSPFTLATVVNVRATQSLLVGDEDAALERYQETIRLSAEVGTTWTLVYGLPGLATVAARRGQTGGGCGALRGGGDDQRRVVTGRRLPAGPGFRAARRSPRCGPSSARRPSRRPGSAVGTCRRRTCPAWADRVRPRRAPS